MDQGQSDQGGTPDAPTRASRRPAGRPWREIPRNAVLTEADVLAFFHEFSRVGELEDADVNERCIFLTRHPPPTNYRRLGVRDKFVQLVKRLEKLDQRCYTLNRDDCLAPDGVVWRTGEEIETVARDLFPEDFMTCTIAQDLYKMWPLLSFMQGIATLYVVCGRGVDLSFKMVALLHELKTQYPRLSKLLDPATVIFNLQGINVDPAAVVIPPGLESVAVPAFPGAVGVWICPSELRAGELIGHLRQKLAPTLLPEGAVPQFCFFNAPMAIL